jgi:glycerate 2-kinase
VHVAGFDLISIARSLVNDVVELSRLDGRVKGYLERLGWRRAVVIAMGKGSIQMALGALNVLEVDGGVIVTPRGTGRPVDGLEVIESSHPLPDESSLKAGEAVLEWARVAGRLGRLLVLVSGGASALVEKPIDPLTIDDVREATRLLLGCGASIHEINGVRKHLSLVKGGRLATTAYPAEVRGLYASDVPGDRLDVIGSGPTVADPTTYCEALEVTRRYGVYERLPERVSRVLEEGCRGLREETPKPGFQLLSRTVNELVAANIDVLRGLEVKLRSMGFNTLILTSRLEGESREVGRALASITMDVIERGVPVQPPAAILAGGETTVRVRGRGRGGRNMELAFSWALSMRYWGYRGEAAILSMDTDGIDGFTDAAGAILVPGLVEELISMGVDPYRVLEDNDTYTAISRVGGLIVTGPTGSNLNSIQVILVSGRSSTRAPS